MSTVPARRRVGLPIRSCIRARSPWALVAVLGAVVATGPGACTSIDRETPRSPSTVLTTDESKATALGRLWIAMEPSDPALSAFRPLPNNLESLAARLALIDAAERTVDLQSFIFNNDDTGLYLVDRLVAAADRGVRIRILIDDLCAHGVETGLALIDAHPNIELRLFNPWTYRGGPLTRIPEFILTPRLNHRMHNKLFIADGTVAIFGGRNLSDEYLGYHTDFDYRDLDVAATGPVAADAGRIFDDFWNGPDAIPVSGFTPRPDVEAQMVEARTRLGIHREKLRNTPYADAVRETEFMQQLRTRSLKWIVARGTVVADSPEKTVRAGEEGWCRTVADELRDPFFAAQKELIACSPYFVPGDAVVDRLCELASRGVTVRILTNSLASNDMKIAHAGYTKYRERLARCGVEVFELRRRGSNAPADELAVPAFGSHSVSLHAKSFVIDRQRVFIGSVNLDPRSIVLNTEIGVFVDNPELAESISGSISSLMSSEWSYRLEISPEGALTWVGQDAAGNETRTTDDPDSSFWDRLSIFLQRMLPVESQI